MEASEPGQEDILGESDEYEVLGSHDVDDEPPLYRPVSTGEMSSRT